MAKVKIRQANWVKCGSVSIHAIRKAIPGCLDKEISALRRELYGLAKETRERKAREGGAEHRPRKPRKLDRHGRNKGEARAHTAALRAKEKADQEKYPTSWAR